MEIIDELVFLKKNEALCDSLLIAEKFHKRHTHVIRLIEQLKEKSGDHSAQIWAQSFHKSSYTDKSGKRNKKYLMNRDGFSMLVMKFTDKDALDWQWKYIEAFNAMEQIIREKSTQAWIETRQAGKLTRKAETDTIKDLIEYAKEQGSTHADMLYMTYSRLAKKIAGIKSRDEATVMQLNNLSLIKHIILNEIRNGIVAEMYYKDIYKNCKVRLEQFKDLAYLEARN